MNLKNSLQVLFIFIGLSLAAGCKPGALKPDNAAGASQAFAVNAKLSPGVNYGNVLEANPPEGWGQKLVLGDFAKMAQAGFKSVRLPVRWSAKAKTNAPYTIDPAFFAQVDSAVNAAIAARLYVVLNMHHYDELFVQPQQHEERFLAMWKQISQHYAAWPQALIFEILNEPHDKLTANLWNPMYQKALAEIRVKNPTRQVIISGAGWGGAAALNELAMPANLDNLIFTFHYYSPFQFTHQGAEWVGSKSNAWVGTRWTGSSKEIQDAKEEFNKAAQFSRRYKVPIFMGEFGAYSKADMDSRVRWTRHVVGLAKRNGFSTAYWEFKTGGFGVYKADSDQWNQELLQALLEP
jgi:endoglucanase